MGQLFEPYEPDQPLLLPPSLHDWLPEGHLARFISETVDELDISAFLAKYKQREDGRGGLAYHPKMMLKLLIYSYCVGIFSSRKIAAGVEDLVALRYLAAGNHPSHRTIARFRQEHIGLFRDLFTQVVQIAMETGLVKMGTLAIDGSKVKGNASKHKAMSYDRLKKEEKRLRREIRRLTDLARGVDEAEDEEFGPDFRGDELPEELQRREARLRKIREAKARLEQEAKDDDERTGRGQHREKTGEGPELQRPIGTPKDSKQTNFTDPESRIMGNPRTGFIQGYNAQIAVDDAEQIVVAIEVTPSPTDNGQLLPLTKAAEENTGVTPQYVVADAGYRYEDDFAALEEAGIEAHVALSRGESTRGVSPGAGPATQRMSRRRRTKKSRRLYKKRKSVVEPVFGWIKAALGFRTFSMRGLAKARGEWDVVCLAINLRRMATRIEWV